jgi:hypothetical protein
MLGTWGAPEDKQNDDEEDSKKILLITQLNNKLCCVSVTGMDGSGGNSISEISGGGGRL